ncbi:hypothetical protein Hanom_Chr17g01542391 [Helianthus anomalus]
MFLIVFHRCKVLSITIASIGIMSQTDTNQIPAAKHKRISLLIINKVFVEF